MLGGFFGRRVNCYVRTVNGELWNIDLRKLKLPLEQRKSVSLYLGKGSGLVSLCLSGRPQ
jgi:hypothetical protein